METTSDWKSRSGSLAGGLPGVRESPTDTFIKRYKVLEKIGEGSYSEVLKCKHRETGNIIACKRLKHVYRNWSQVNDIAEITTLRTLTRHSNILQMLEIHYDQALGKVSLVFELMELNLYELIKDRKRLLPETRVRFLMFQLLRALKHLHKHGIFHRDIKPENILLRPKAFGDGKIPNQSDLLKLGDLGSVRGLYSRPPYTEYISTRWYRSPECLLTAGHYSFKMDIWAAGCVFYEILTLRPLFPGSSELDQINRIHSLMGTPTIKLVKKFQKLSSVERGSYKNRSQRSRWDMITKVMDELDTKNSYALQEKSNSYDWFFQNKEGGGLDRAMASHISLDAKDILKSMLSYDPDHRPSAHRMLQHKYFTDVKDMSGKERESKTPVITVYGDEKGREMVSSRDNFVELRTLGDKKHINRRLQNTKYVPQQTRKNSPDLDTRKSSSILKGAASPETRKNSPELDTRMSSPILKETATPQQRKHSLELDIRMASPFFKGPASPQQRKNAFDLDTRMSSPIPIPKGPAPVHTKKHSLELDTRKSSPILKGAASPETPLSKRQQRMLIPNSDHSSAAASVASKKDKYVHRSTSNTLPPGLPPSKPQQKRLIPQNEQASVMASHTSKKDKHVHRNTSKTLLPPLSKFLQKKVIPQNEEVSAAATVISKKDKYGHRNTSNTPSLGPSPSKIQQKKVIPRIEEVPAAASINSNKDKFVYRNTSSTMSPGPHLSKLQQKRLIPQNEEVSAAASVTANKYKFVFRNTSNTLLPGPLSKLQPKMLPKKEQSAAAESLTSNKYKYVYRNTSNTLPLGPPMSKLHQKMLILLNEHASAAASANNNKDKFVYRSSTKKLPPVTPLSKPQKKRLTPQIEETSAVASVTYNKDKYAYLNTSKTLPLGPPLPKPQQKRVLPQNEETSAAASVTSSKDKYVFRNTSNTLPPILLPSKLQPKRLLPQNEQASAASSVTSNNNGKYAYLNTSNKLPLIDLSPRIKEPLRTPFQNTDAFKRRAQRIRAQLRAEVYCSSDDEIVSTIRSKLDELVSIRAQQYPQKYKRSRYKYKITLKKSDGDSNSEREDYSRSYSLKDDRR